jgi:deoxyribose-phosphate aldolase
LTMKTLLPQTTSELAQMIDHTLLKPEAKPGQIDRLCSEARQYGFASVCVNPVHVRRCAKALRGSAVKVSTVIGFPLGANTSEVKGFEAAKAIQDGATELDMVINVGALKAGELAQVRQDIRHVVNAASASGALVKAIIEACLLTDEEKVTACQLAHQAGADYVKTSTGFSTGGATFEDVTLMRRTVGSEMGVKAAGGVRTLADARRMIEAGASRLGSSVGVKIVLEMDSE